MEIGREEVVHVARLSRLTLTEEEISRMQGELAEILDYMKLLETADPAMDASGGTAHHMREDTVCPSMDRARLLRNAPVHDRECIIVPQTVE